MKSKFTVLQLTLLFLLVNVLSAFSQTRPPLDIALVEVNKKYAEWDLKASDIVNMQVSSTTYDETTGIGRVWLQQTHAGIKIHQAILNLSIDNQGKVFFVGNRFIAAADTKVNGVLPALTATQAMQKVFTNLEIIHNDALQIKKQVGTRQYEFAGEGFARDKVKAELKYQSIEDGKSLMLAWNILIKPLGNNDFFNISVDALTGEIIEKYNLTQYCSLSGSAYHKHDAHCQSPEEKTEKASSLSSNLAEDGSKYRVFAVPTQSPAHGDRSLVENPAWLTASPYGWHDTDGIDGPEHTITRGNNAWAFEDRDNNGVSAANEPNGGSDLIFDEALNVDNEPVDYVDAATVNLFYMVNVMHDFSNAMGFTPNAGAMQTNNYGEGGVENDAIIALAQQGANANIVNNAEFIPSIDGEQSYINMFVWDQSSDAQYLSIDEPASIAGTYQTGVTQGWGMTITTSNPVSGQLVEVNDNVFNAIATDACEELINGADVMGKIALIDRGGCGFGTKVLNAENSGAIAAVICNYEEATTNMLPGADGSQVSIPAVFIKSNDCAVLRQFVEDGLEITLVAPAPVDPVRLDGDLDNGVIAHEYGHGISSRLTCGPGEFGLTNREQAGEGWSDFLSLIMTVEPGDTGDMLRGVGTYVSRQANDAFGIRRYPYTTDMSINPLTYANVAGNTRIHPVGEVWCSTLWDLYWAFVEEYGWDADIYEGTGGNNKLVRLVFEGMKNQPCSPGFVDARDAIIAADETINGGENACLIWEVFARRGLGYYADQGSPLSAADQTADFEPMPICVQELKIKKDVTPLVVAGENIEVTLTIVNHKPQTLTGITISDIIPEGTSFVSGSSSEEATVSGNNLSFTIGDIAYEEEVIITYSLSTDPDLYSIRRYYEDVEGDISEWGYDTFFPEDITNNWQFSTNNSNSGAKSFFVLNIGVPSVEALVLTEPIMVDGDNPVLRFYHNYNTESGEDAGLFEITTGDPTELSTLWTNLGDNMFRGEYPWQVEYLTFSTPNLFAFSGDSDGWVSTYADISEYAGQEVYIRYRFGTDDAVSDVGWYVDDIEFMNMVNYNSEVCISSTEGDMACFTPEGRGTIIESQLMTSTFEPVGENLTVAVYPNPAKDLVHVHMNPSEATDVQITLYSVDGRLLQSKAVKVVGEMDVPMDVSNLAEGFYFLHINAEGDVYTEKLVID